MGQLIIFSIGLLFLIIFSIKDLKHSRVSNNLILVYLFFSLIIFLANGYYIIQISFLIFWILLGGLFWKFKILGGADYKILIINSLLLNLIVPNMMAGQFLFIMLLGINGLLYGVIGKILKAKSEIPFVPIITLTYIQTYLFWAI